MKKVLFCIFFCLILVGCGKKKTIDAVSQKVIDDINNLGTVTLEKEEEINKIYERYNSLTDKQKEDVDNYITLVEAQDEIDRLKEQLKIDIENEIAQKEREEKEKAIIEKATDFNYITDITDRVGVVPIRAIMVYDVDNDNIKIYYSSYYWYDGSEKFYSFDYASGEYVPNKNGVKHSSIQMFEGLHGDYEIQKNLTSNKEDILDEGVKLYYDATDAIKNSY